MPLWSEEMPDRISGLKLLTCGLMYLYPGERSACNWEECIPFNYWIKCFINVCLSVVLFKSVIYLLMFCLGDLSIAESEMLKSFITVSQSILLFRAINICCMCLGPLILGTYIYNCYFELNSLLLLLFNLFLYFLIWSLFYLI
jgi:hypothetical protein